MKKGTNISHYRILEKLGEGGMGVVYKAHDTKLDRTVALKFLPSHFTDSEDSKERFIREAKTAATLNHPNICTIYSIDEYEGPTYDSDSESSAGRQHFISMEYIDGTTLREKMKSGDLSLSTVLAYAKGITSALSAAHEKGIVHRDIKPENIMVDTEDRIKVTDFGLARVNGTHNLTKEGRIIGTMAYMSPEQLQYGEVDERSDLFSVGIVLYEMLTGIHPFEGEYEQATGFKLVNENPDPPSAIRPGIPPGIEEIVLRCLEKECDKRYQSARDLTTELEGESSWPLGIAAERKNGHKLISYPFRLKRNPWLWVAAGILILALGGWLYTLNSGTELPAEKHIAVLPFNNFSPETIPAGISDGMTEIVTSKITRMETQQGALWVVSSSEIRREQVSSPSDAVRLFGVNMAVTGSLHLVGDRFSMTINLVDGTTLRQIRSEVIERDWGGTDFAQFQDDVLETLDEMLELELGSSDFETILAGSSEDPRAYQLYIEGKGALSRFEDPEKIDEAIDLFEEAVEHDPGYALAYAGLAEAHWRKFDLTRETKWTEFARRYAGEAMELSNDLPEVYITLALINNGMGRYNETLEILNSLDEEESSRYDALIQKAEAYRGLGQLEEAEKTYQLAIEQKKNYWGGYHTLGVFYFQNSRWEEAAEAFRIVTELTPDNVRGFNNLGGVYMAMENNEQAIQAFERSLEIRPSQHTYLNLGSLYFYQKNYTEASRVYEQATKIAENDYRTWGYLGTAYYWAGEDSAKMQQSLERAIELVEQELEINPNDQALLRHLASYHILLGNTGTGKNLVEELTALPNLDADSQGMIGNLYELLGEREMALEWIEKALDNGYRVELLKDLEGIQDLLEEPEMQELLTKYEDE